MSHNDPDHSCPVCDGGSMEAYRTHMRELIKQHKVAIAGVLSDAPGMANFAYTVGLSVHGMPELLMIANCNIPLESMQSVLNEVAFRWLKQGNADTGISTEVLRPFGEIPMPVELVLVNRKEAQTNWTVQVAPILSYLGSRFDYDVVQLILPDDHGRLPSMADYDKEKFPQALLAPAAGPSNDSVH